MLNPMNQYIGSFEFDVCTRAAVLGRIGWPAPRDPDLWMRSMAGVVDEGLAGLALGVIGPELAAGEVGAALRQAATDRALESMLIDGCTAPVLAELQTRGLPFVVMKGPAAARFYPSVSDRPYTDIDIIVPVALFTQVRKLLDDLGMRANPDVSQPWPHFDRWCREGVNLARDDGAALDLHHHIPPWRWGHRLSFERIRAQADVIDIAGVDAPVVGVAHHLAISVLHLLSDSWHRRMAMLTLADIVNAAQLGPTTHIAEELRWLRVDWLVADVLDTFPAGVVPAELRSQLRSTGPLIERSILQRVLPPSMSSRHPLAFALRLPARNMAAFVAGSAVPSPAYMRRRYGSSSAYPRWWRQATRWGLDAAAGRDVGSPHAAHRLDVTPTGDAGPNPPATMVRC